MHWLRGVVGVLAVVVCAGLCLGVDTPATAVQPSNSVQASAQSTSPACANSNGSSTDCVEPPAAASPVSAIVPAGRFVQPSRKDRKAAHQAFDRGLQFQKSNELDEAFSEFEEAARLSPLSTEYIGAREMTRENLVSTHLDRGNTDMLQHRQAEALAEFRTALNLDPQNEFAQQRLRDAAGRPAIDTTSPVQVVDREDRLTVRPIEKLANFHYVGDARGLLVTIATSYGLSITFDDSFPTRRVHFDLDQVDFATAMRAASAATKTFSVPVEDKVLYAAADSPENHRLYDRMGMCTLYIPTGGDSAKDLQDIANFFRSTLEARFVSVDPASSRIVVRAPMAVLDAGIQVVEQLDAARPEVLLDVSVMEVDHTFARNIGLHVPDQFNLYNIPAAAFAALGGQNAQDLINQLISGGGINQAGNQSIAALLSQLSGQSSSIFNTPLATFGGGLTLEGLSLDHLAAVLSLNESSVQSLQHVTLRASQDKEATFKLGARYPVLNASFSPISTSPQVAAVLGNQSYTAPFPSVNYEDIGLTLKAKPTVHHNSDVSLELTLQMRALGATNNNGIPIITNREFTGGILLKDGEPAFIAGMITVMDQRSLSGLPLFSQIPGFGVLTSQNSKQSEEDELLILLTPHVLSDPRRTDTPLIWLK